MPTYVQGLQMAGPTISMNANNGRIPNSVESHLIPRALDTNTAAVGSHRNPSLLEIGAALGLFAAYKWSRSHPRSFGFTVVAVVCIVALAFYFAGRTAKSTAKAPSKAFKNKTTVEDPTSSTKATSTKQPVQPNPQNPTNAVPPSDLKAIHDRIFFLEEELRQRDMRLEQLQSKADSGDEFLTWTKEFCDVDWYFQIPSQYEDWGTTSDGRSLKEVISENEMLLREIEEQKKIVSEKDKELRRTTYKMNLAMKQLDELYPGGLRALARSKRSAKKPENSNAHSSGNIELLEYQKFKQSLVAALVAHQHCSQRHQAELKRSQALEAVVEMRPARGFRTLLGDILKDIVVNNAQESTSQELTPITLSLMSEELAKYSKPSAWGQVLTIECSPTMQPSKEAQFTDCPKTPSNAPAASFVGDPLEGFPPKSWFETNKKGVFIHTKVNGLWGISSGGETFKIFQWDSDFQVWYCHAHLMGIEFRDGDFFFFTGPIEKAKSEKFWNGGDKGPYWSEAFDSCQWALDNLL